MKTRLIKPLGVLLLCAGLFATPVSAAVKNEILPAPTRVTTHLYAWIGPHGGPSKENKGFRMNLGFVVGKDAVAVIETGYHEPMAREMLAQVMTLCGLTTAVNEIAPQ